MAGLIDPGFARFLEANRDQLNAIHAAARRQQHLDDDRFAAALATVVGPTFAALTDGEQDVAMVDRVGVALFRAALDLHRHGLFSPLMVTAWQRLLSRLGPVVAVGRQPLIGPAANAVVSLEATAGARPGPWIDTMVAVTEVIVAEGPGADDIDRWLRAGQVAAWRCGLAAFRPAALDLADGLDQPVLEAIFAAKGDRRIKAWSTSPPCGPIPGSIRPTAGSPRPAVERARSDGSAASVGSVVRSYGRRP